MARLLRRIKTDGWRGFLAEVRPTELGKIYKYIQKADGRKPRTYTYPCAAPLRKGEELYTTGQAKCDLLGQYFEERLGNPNFLSRYKAWREETQEKPRRQSQGKENQGKLADRKGEGQNRKNKGTGRGKGRKPSRALLPIGDYQRDFKPVRLVEVTSAIKSLALHKAPGPDGFSADVFKNLPGVYPFLARLYSSILQ